MFSGSFTVFIQNEQMVNVAMMIPILLWAMEKLFDRSSGQNIALAALIFGLLLLAGTPGVILYSLFLAGAYYLFKAARLKIDGTSFKRLILARAKKLLALVASFILGLGLAAPLFFPFFEFLSSVVYNFRLDHGSLSVPWYLSGLIISPIMAETPTFFRLQPTNGLWDSLGGYSGILCVCLVLLGLFMGAIFFKKKIRSPYLPLFYFFFAFALFICLKNLGVLPFAWLGYLPFFELVWSPRWAGPVWVFCLAAAAAFAFELLKNKSGELLEAVRGSRSSKLFTVSFFTAASLALVILPVLFYVKIPGFFPFYTDRIITALPLTRWELFINSWLTSLSILGTALLLVVSFIRNKNKSSLYALLALALLELWVWLPRGYALGSMRFKSGLFIFGLFVILAVWKNKWAWAKIGGFLFLLLFLFLDIAAPDGLPQRSDPFTAPPFVNYLKNQGGYWRVMGDTTTLMPNWASAFGLMDVRYVNETGTINWYRYYRRYSLDDTLLDWSTLSPWFTGRKFYYPEVKDFTERTDLCPVLTFSEFMETKERDFVEDKIRSLLPFYSLLGVRYILTSAPDINKNIRQESPLYFPPVYNGEVNIFENQAALKRAFIVHQTDFAPNFQKAQRKLAEEDFDPGKTVILEEALSLGDHAPAPEQDFATIEDYTPNKVVISAETKTPGILVLTDVFYPGWKAFLDGQETKVYRVDGLVRGVYLPQGHHQIIFRYAPISFSQGLLVALLSLLACVILLIFLK